MNKELTEKVDDWLTDYGRDCYSRVEDYYQKDTKKAEYLINLCADEAIGIIDDEYSDMEYHNGMVSYGSIKREIEKEMK